MLGKIYQCQCVSIEDDVVWLKVPSGIQVQLPRQELPVGIYPGHHLEVFCYWNQRSQAMATIHKPLALVGDFERLVVKNITPQGAWLDWGISERLFLPAYNQTHVLQVDERVIVYLEEKNERIIATQKFSEALSGDVSQCRPGDPVFLIVYQVEGDDAYCIVDNTWMGKLDIHETHKGVKVAQTFNGYIKEITQDNQLLLTLKSVAYSPVMEEAQVLVDRLVEAGGFLPLHLDSDPKEIRRLLSLSKKEFKKMLTGLSKQDLLHIEKEGIYLKKP